MTPLALPRELSRDKTDRLRPPPPGPGRRGGGRARAGAVPEAQPGPRRRAVRLAKRVAHRVLGERGVDKLRGYLRVDEALRLGSESLRRTAELEQQVASMQRSALEAELVQAEAHAASVNLELLKGEVRSVIQALEDLGMAIAPAAGLAGAGERLSELRERVNGLDRRLRSLQAQAADNRRRARPRRLRSPPRLARRSRAGRPPRPPRPCSTTSASSGGSGATPRRSRPPWPSATSTCWWPTRRWSTSAAAGPSWWSCCPAGGWRPSGSTPTRRWWPRPATAGWTCARSTAAASCAGREPGSLGAIIATHLVEHLEFADLVELLELAATRLRPGGLFIAETPNPTSLVVLGNSFILDPTHLRPLHPSLLTFLCEGAGFRDVRLRFHAPATDYHLPMIDDPDAPPWTKRVNDAFAKLNSVLFGPQEYALIATAAPATDGATGEEHP